MCGITGSNEYAIPRDAKVHRICMNVVELYKNCNQVSSAVEQVDEQSEVSLHQNVVLCLHLCIFVVVIFPFSIVIMRNPWVY